MRICAKTDFMYADAADSVSVFTSLQISTK